MSLQECTAALHAHGGAVRINGGEFSQSELEQAAAIAAEENAQLIIDNIKGRSCEDIGRILEAGGRQVCFADIYLV